MWRLFNLHFCALWIASSLKRPLLGKDGKPLCLKWYWINVTCRLYNFVPVTIYDACKVEETSWINFYSTYGKLTKLETITNLQRSATAQAVNGYLTVTTKTIHWFATVKNASPCAWMCKTTCNMSNTSQEFQTRAKKSIPCVTWHTSQGCQPLHKTAFNMTQQAKNSNPCAIWQTINTQFSTWHKQFMNVLAAVLT